MSVLDLDDPARSVGAQPGPSVASGRFKALVRRADFRRGGIMLPFLALFITLSVASGPFLTKTNLLNIVDQQASTLIPAVAVTLVLVTGGIDLSIGAVYGLASVVAANLALSVSPVLAIAAGLLVGLVVGLVNGVIITVFRINALDRDPGDLLRRERHI